MLLTERWWIVVECATSQAMFWLLNMFSFHILDVGWVQSRCYPQCNVHHFWCWAQSSPFKAGLSEQWMQATSVQGHDTRLTASISVNVLPLICPWDFCSCFCPIEDFISHLLPQNWTFPPKLFPALNSVLASKLLPSPGWHIYISGLMQTPITYKSHQLHLGQWRFWG